MNRNKQIIRTSLVGIGGNLLLSAFKFAVGLIANSVSIKTDAINNIANALSSVITIVGTKLSEREPDRKHPFGYGRVEYLTSLIIGTIIMYAGFEALRESVKRISNPEPNDYSTAAMIIVSAGVIVKILMGIYTKRKGRQLRSAALIASGQDNLDDSIASAATLLAAVIYVTSGFSIEAYVGLVISCLIIKTGIETIRDTVGSLLGERVDQEKAAAVKKSILSFPEVDGVFDLVIHNYGRERLIGSAHIEIPDVLTSGWIDNLQRAITKKVMEDTGVEMLGITIYAVNSRDAEAMQVEDSIRNLLKDNKSIIGIHGFYLDKIDKEIKFDVVTDFDVKDSKTLCESIRDKVKRAYPAYNIGIVVKKDFAD